MDVSELRKKILRALDEARVDAASKRGERDETQRAYDQFLETVAVPLLRQAQGILKAERQMFTKSVDAVKGLLDACQKIAPHLAG